MVMMMVMMMMIWGIMVCMYVWRVCVARGCGAWVCPGMNVGGCVGCVSVGLHVGGSEV